MISGKAHRLMELIFSQAKGIHTKISQLSQKEKAGDPSWDPRSCETQQPD